jgi:hypothetical protein
MSSPEFKAALKRYSHLSETLGAEHDITKDAFTVLFSLAPDEYIDEAHKIAIEMDLLPEASGYLVDGSPMYKLDDIAAKHGVTIEEAEQSMHEMLAARVEAGLPIDGVISTNRQIHRKQ